MNRRKTAHYKFLYFRLNVLIQTESVLFAIVDFFRRRRAKVVYKLSAYRKNINDKTMEGTETSTRQAD